jgi:hypothetical protein
VNDDSGLFHDMFFDIGTEHKKLIQHELGHAFCAQAVGLKVQQVYAPPPDLALALTDPDRPAGWADWVRPADQRARAVAVLGGPLAEGKLAPAWPIRPTTEDERLLAEIFRDAHELEYLEAVRDTREILAAPETERCFTFASELLTHPPHRLTGLQLDHIRNPPSVEPKSTRAAPEVTPSVEPRRYYSGQFTHPEPDSEEKAYTADLRRRLADPGFRKVYSEYKAAMLRPLTTPPVREKALAGKRLEVATFTDEPVQMATINC